MSDGILCLSTFQTVSQFSFWKNPKRKCIVRLFLSNSILTGLNNSAINKTNKTINAYSIFSPVSLPTTKLNKQPNVTISQIDIQIIQSML